MNNNINIEEKINDLLGIRNWALYFDWVTVIDCAVQMINVLSTYSLKTMINH